MARKKIRASDDGINMTPMIDVVFQMIIFFVCTIDMDKKQFDERIRLAMAPHGKAVEKKDPRTVIVDVNRRGSISISRARMSPAVLEQVMRRTVGRYGQSVPVVIRGDMQTRHEDIRTVMDRCSRAGIWKVKFSALKEKAKTVE
jgi:biopolymer transport protein ExbD